MSFCFLMAITLLWQVPFVLLVQMVIMMDHMAQCRVLVVISTYWIGTCI